MALQGVRLGGSVSYSRFRSTVGWCARTLSLQCRRQQSPAQASIDIVCSRYLSVSAIVQNCCEPAMPTINDKGEFVRPETSFRNWIRPTADGSSGFPAASGRYHLYVSYACPFASRTLIGLALKGLQNAVSVTIMDPKMAEKGWIFTDKEPECTLDTVNGKSTLREVYELAQPGYSGRVSVPVLWDKEKKTIVSNESAEILRMMGLGVFDAFCATDEQRKLDLYPQHLRKEIDEMNDYIYPNINNSVYRAGFATKQDAYETAVTELFTALEKIECLLAKQRFLVGNSLTEADVRLVTTLFRFDMSYHGLFKCNRKMLKEFPNLWAYTRDIYQTGDVSKTVNLYHINTHYWWSSATINPTRVVPVGPELNFLEPHGRERLS